MNECKPLDGGIVTRREQRAARPLPSVARNPAALRDGISAGPCASFPLLLLLTLYQSTHAHTRHNTHHPLVT